MTLRRVQSISLVIRSVVFVAVWASPLFAQRAADSTRVRSFVSEFYTWYVPLAFSDTLRVPASTIALRERPAAFTVEFRSALTDELIAQRQPGADPGLNFDPILISQDPCERYDIGWVRFSRPAFLVELIPICGGVRSPYQDGVIAEVVQKNGAWQFANFHGPRDKTDVLKVLKWWREARAKVRRPPRPA
jgi:hypothetical protein